MLMGTSKIEAEFENYLAQTEAAIGSDLDENTRKELKFAYLAGACACFGIIVKASQNGNATEHMAFGQEMVDVGYRLAGELKAAGVKWTM